MGKVKKLFKKTALVMCIVITLIMVLFLADFENVLLKPLITGVSISKEYGDILVVFGGGLRKDLGMRIGFSTRERLDLAIKLYHEKPRKLLVSDGSLYRNSPAISLIQNYLEINMVKKEDILFEGQSQTTFDNVKNLIIIIKKFGFQELVICTSPYHQQRCQMILEREEITNYLMAKIDKSEVYDSQGLRQKFRNTKLILHEYFAIAYLYLLGN